MKKMQLYLSLVLPVSLNKLYINEYKWNPNTHKREPTGKRILSDDGVMCKKLIQKYAIKQLKKQDWDYEWTKTGFLYMDTVIYFNKSGRDDDNVYKVLKDSLQKICYDNDSRVLVRTQKIFFDSVNPHIEVILHPIDYIGIFNNEEELNEFIENCKTCKWYKEGKCSVLTKAKEGRIQEDIENMMCKKYIEKKSKKE